MRLIDADKFIEDYHKLVKSAERYSLDDYISGMITIGMLVHNQPTAYDVEKVLEELGKELTDCGDCYEETGMRAAYIKAIEIVKRGGA